MKQELHRGATYRSFNSLTFTFEMKRQPLGLPLYESLSASINLYVILHHEVASAIHKQDINRLPSIVH